MTVVFGKKKKRKQPSEVFTPRQSEVSDMYISRPALERDLSREIMGTKHIIIHGESGCGKSWLYKKVLSDMEIKYCVINLANAARYDSITEAIKLVLADYIRTMKVGYTQTTSAEVSFHVAKGQYEHTGDYIIKEGDPVEALFEQLYEDSNKKTSILVFENLESIFNNVNLMNEIGYLIMLLDDERYARYKVKFIIVGVPSGVIEYFSKVKNLPTISNRLSEIAEVSKLDEDQISTFVTNGFIEELMIEFNPYGLYHQFEEHIAWVTNGLPQRLHEYCLELSHLCEDNHWIPREHHLLGANIKWISHSISKNYFVIDRLMNSKETTVGRRNQVLYSLGLIETSRFTSTVIESILKSEFPNSTKGSNLNIGKTLKYISETEDPIIKKTPKGNSWLFSDPLYLLCIRAMLFKTYQEKIEKYEMSEILKLN